MMIDIDDDDNDDDNDDDDNDVGDVVSFCVVQD